MHIFPEDVKKAFEAMPIPLAYYQNIEGSITAVLVSDGLCDMMNADRKNLLELLNHGLFERVHPEDRAQLARTVKEFGQHLRPYDVVYRAKYSPDGEYRTIHSIGRFQPTDDGSELALFTYTDVSDSQSANRQMAENYDMLRKDRFYTDSLTGLPNINYMNEFNGEKTEKIWDNGHTPVVFYFDINGLRSYNQQYGFSRGDELLKLTADMLKIVFPEDTIIRAADDHFVVISTYIDEKNLTDKINVLNNKIKAGAYGNTAGVQAGICIMEKGMSIQDAADHAKHAHRQIGNDINILYVIYTHETDERYWNQRYILETFEQAIQENWIKVYYQAIMRVKNGKAAALEALARWVDPLRGIISPGDFIPVLEKYHLLYRLDLYMVEQICKEVPQRKAIGLPIIPITVNFSAQDFDHADIVKSLNDIFERYQLSRDHIIIEITEQDLAKASGHFKNQVKSLRENGYRIWIDDFGSGYSSLNIFSQFKVNVTKFDIEFLRHLDDNNGANRHIMKAMVEVCRKMGIACLAEGVETPEQLEFLKEIGCDMAQGFYYYRPQSLGEITFKIRNGNPIINCESKQDLEQSRKEWDEINK